MPRRVLQGVVTSDKANKTITVLVERRIMHSKYKKYVKKSSKYSAHDETNACKIGDFVSIEECRPISKSKSWKVIEGRDRKGKPLDIPAFDPANTAAAPQAAKPAKAPAAKKEAKPAAEKKPAAKKTKSKE
jgi:small subunit ribosomal protein S17